MKKNIRKEGQILLVVVLLLAAALTMVMTIVFTSRTENQVSKLQQDADKSLVAAEAGIEAAIKTQSSGTFSDLNLNALRDSGIDTTKSKVTVENASSAQFVSPLLSKDQQYTLYLTSYDNGTFGTNPFNSSIVINYGNEVPCNSIALELTVVSFDGTQQNPDYTVNRYVADTATPRILGDEGTQIGATLKTPLTIKTTTFNCGTSAIPLPAAPAGAKVMFIRVIGPNATTKIGINDAALPVQGKYYSAEARSTSGVTKKIKLFQSYPQLPAEFFVTSF